MFDNDLLTYLEEFLTCARIQRFKEVLEQRTNYITVAVEDVYQLHNTSAVLRSCDAFGVQEVHLVEDRFGKRLDKNIAMGAEQWVDIYRHKSTENCIAALRKKGYQIIATVPHGACTSLIDFKLSKPTALIFGTEKDGLSEAVMQNADGYLTIPMSGFTESLNISVAAAICICQLTTALRKSSLPWNLTEKEVLEKRLDWTKKSIKDVEGIIRRYRSR